MCCAWWVGEPDLSGAQDILSSLQRLDPRNFLRTNSPTKFPATEPRGPTSPQHMGKQEMVAGVLGILRESASCLDFRPPEPEGALLSASTMEIWDLDPSG